MSGWYDEPEEPVCPACRGEDEDCSLCGGCGYVSRQERRDYIADARAEQAEE